jgi:hypothetical protein
MMQEALVRKHQELEQQMTAKLDGALKAQAAEFKEQERQKTLADLQRKSNEHSPNGSRVRRLQQRQSNDPNFEDKRWTAGRLSNQYPDSVRGNQYGHGYDPAVPSPALMSAVLPASLPTVPFETQFERRKKWGGVHYQVIFFKQQLGLIFEVDKQYENLLCVGRNAFDQSTRYLVHLWTHWFSDVQTPHTVYVYALFCSSQQ